MGTVGTNTWGVLLSSAEAAGSPSGNICYFLCNDFNRKKMDKNRAKHKPGRTHYTINTKVSWYEATLNQCRVADNTVATMNSYHAYITAWMEAKTEVYLWIIDAAATKLDWYVAGSMQDWLPCVVMSPLEDSLAHNEKAINIKVEEI